MKLMSRLGAAALATATLVTALPAAAETTLKVSLFTPPVSPLNEQFERIKAGLAEATGGELVLELYESSQMGPPVRQFDLVRTGVADITVVFLGLTPGRFSMSQLAEMPGMSDPGVSEEASYAVSQATMELGTEYLADEYPSAMLLNVAMLPNPIILTKQEVTKLSDIEGLRLRHPGEIHAATIEKLGGVPVLVQPTELAEALSRGQIDGALTAYSGIMNYQLQDSAKFAYELPTGGLEFAVVMNTESYENLPDDLKPAFDEYFGAGGQDAWGRLLGAGEVRLREHLETLGVQVRQPSEEDLATFNAMVPDLQEAAIEALESEGKPARAFAEALREKLGK